MPWESSHGGWELPHYLRTKKYIDLRCSRVFVFPLREHPVVTGNKSHNRKSNKAGEVKATSPSARKSDGRRRLNAVLGLALMIFVQALMVGQALAQSNQATYNGQGNGTFQDASITSDAAATSATTQNYGVPAVPFVSDLNNAVPTNVHGGTATGTNGSAGGSAPGIDFDVNKLLKRDNPNGIADSQPFLQQPKVFIPGQFLNANSGQNLQQQFTEQQAATQQAVQQAVQQANAQQASSLFVQAAEQNTAGLTNNPQASVSNLVNQSLGSINDTYRGLHQWFNDDWIGNLFSQIGQLIGKWISEIIDGWIADSVQFLGAFLRVFVLNPNVAVNGLNGTQSDGISPFIRQAADVMYGIACDLLLLLFILAIWKYWAEAAWRGAGNLMGAVGRLIFTAGLLLAFPTLYAFEIQITNEMIQAIYFNNTQQITMLDSALASAVRGGILAGVGGLASAFAPLLGGALGGAALGLVGEVFAFAGLVIFLILGGVLIAELVYILILKATQTGLLTAQYMFAPIFLVFFATPDTENVATGFVKAWVETSLWTFVWVGLLKVLTIVMFSDFNPWGKILMAVGVLQMMIQVPSFLARAQISPMSDFISAGLITGGLLKMFGWMGKTASSRVQQGLGYMTGDKIGQQGFNQTTKNGVGDLPSQNGEHFDKLKSLRDRVNGKDGKTGDGKTGAGLSGMKTDNQGNVIDPVTGKALKRDKDGNLVDPTTGKPITAAQRDALGLPPPGKKSGAAAGEQLSLPGLEAPGKTLKSGSAAAAGVGLGVGAAVAAGAGAAAAAGGAAGAVGTAGTAPTTKTAVDPTTDKGLQDKLNSLVKDGKVKEGEAEKFRAALAQGKNVSSAAAAAGMGAAVAGALAASLGAAGATAGGPGGVPGKKQDEHLTVPGSEDPGKTMKPGGATATVDQSRQFGPPTKEGEERAKQLEPAIKGMQAKGQMTEEQAKNFRAAIASGKSVNEAAKLAGLGAVGMAGAGAGPDLKAGGKSTEDVTVPGADGGVTSKGGTQVELVGGKGDVSTSKDGVANLEKLVGAAAMTSAGMPPGGTQQVRAHAGQKVNATANANASATTTNQAPEKELTANEQRIFNLLTSNGIDPKQALTHAKDPAMEPLLNGGGGSGGDDKAKTISHLKNPSLSDLDQSGLYMVAGARGPIGDIRALKLQVRGGQQEGRVHGTTRGGASRIDIPEDATPAQTAGIIATAGYANEINNDPAAMDAARGAAVQAGAHRPQGFAQGLMANMNSYFGGTWAKTGLGKNQFQNAMYSAAVEGSQAYVANKSGNAYTEYLRGRLGACDQERMDNLTLISTDPEAAESAWNAGITQATDRLIASGTKISSANRGAALNPYTASLRPAAAGSAIRAMVRHGMEDPRMQQFLADNPNESVNSSVGSAMLGEVLRTMDPDKAAAAHLIYMRTGGADLSSNVVDSVSSLAVQSGMKPGEAYTALSNNIGGLAAKMTGNSAFRNCKSFDQVRSLCAQNYGDAGGIMYDDIVSNAHDLSQLGVGSMGRSYVNPHVASAFHDMLEDSGGIVIDSNDLAARDNRKMAANSVKVALAARGPQALTGRSAHAVYSVASTGGNVDRMGEQDIFVAEQLMDMGASRITSQLVAVKREVDADGSRGVDLGTLETLASNVSLGTIRADQSMAALNVLRDGGNISRDSVEVQANLQSMGAYTQDSSRAVLNLVSSGVCRSGAAAAAVYTMAVRSAANEANIDMTGKSIADVEGMLKAQSGGAVNAGSISSDIASIKVAGNFDDRQLADPAMFAASYDAMHDPSASSHRLQSIRITERIHGHGAISDPGVLQVYDDLLENGVKPNDLTDDYVGLQRYYAASAYQNASQQYGQPRGKSTPPAMDTRTLDRIRTDPRFVMRNARPNNPPAMNQYLYDELWR
jgi:hypothetical protein